jgi:hypothetical protein
MYHDRFMNSGLLTRVNCACPACSVPVAVHALVILIVP